MNVNAMSENALFKKTLFLHRVFLEYIFDKSQLLSLTDHTVSANIVILAVTDVLYTKTSLRS